MKKIFKNITFILLAFIMSFAFIACSEENPDDDSNKKTYTTILEVINNNEKYTSGTLNIDETITFDAKYDASATIDLLWTITDESILSCVSKNTTSITVKALKAGTTTIKLEDKLSNLVKQIEIEVKEEVKEIPESVKQEFDDFIKTIPLSVNKDLPTSTTLNIFYQFDKGIASDGKITLAEENQVCTGKVILTYENQTIEKELTITIYGNFIVKLAEKFMSQFPKDGIDTNFDITTQYDDYGGTRVTFTSLNLELLSNVGEYTRPFNNTYVDIKFTIKTKDPVAKVEFTDKVLLKGQSLEEKNVKVEEWICKAVPENSVLYANTVLPDYCDDYEGTITYYDKKGNIADLAKLANDPILGETVVLTVRVKYPNSSENDYKDFVLDYRVWNKEYKDTWEKIDDFVKALNQSEVRSYTYYSRGYTELNSGYLPFYENKDSVINTKYLLSYTYGYICTGIQKTSTEYITIHDTAGGLPTHTPYSFAVGQQTKNNNKSNTEYISWHFTVGAYLEVNDGSEVDKSTIYQSLPLDEVGYHAGDGSRPYGLVWTNGGKTDCIGGGNRNSIGIESCINHGADYNDTMRILAKLVAELLLQYNLSIDRIKQHYNFTGKDCPGVIRHCGRWEEFLNLCRLEYFAKTELKDVDFKWTSLSTDLLDDTGHITNSTGKEITVDYKVNVSYNKVDKEYKLSSKILERTDIKQGDWE